MSSTEQLDALREKNKDLLKRLERQREKLESVSSCSQGRKRERQDEVEEIVTRPDGDRRSALSKLTVRFAGNASVRTEAECYLTLQVYMHELWQPRIYYTAYDVCGVVVQEILVERHVVCTWPSRCWSGHAWTNPHSPH